MDDEWADSGVDLPLRLPARGAGEALRTELRSAIRTGRLPAGTRLPPSRTLAVDLGVARNTVAEAYARLAAEGWLETLVGSGTHVAAGRSDAPPRDEPATPASPRLDLRPGRPDVSFFPRVAWSRAMADALRDAPSAAFDYGDPRGAPELRRALGGYLGRVRAAVADPERIVVTAGVTDGLGSLWRLLARTGRSRLAVEEFGLPPLSASATTAGLEVVAAPMDAEGVDVSVVRADVLLVTPAHHFPSGVVLSPDRRRAVGALAGRGTLVVEDDYDGEFRFDRAPVGALQSLLPDSVVLAGTVSKTLAPGIRLGWLVLPSTLVAPLAELRQESGGAPSVVDQLALARMIDTGTYDHHVRRMRIRYRRRRNELAAALGSLGIRIEGIAAGMHAVVPTAIPEEELIARAARRGLALDGLARYALPGAIPRPSALVVGYGTPAEHVWPEALEELVAVLRS